MFIVHYFFFQAEDGIRDGHVTGVQTCALPIFLLGGVSGCGLGVSGAGLDSTGVVSTGLASTGFVPTGFVSFGAGSSGHGSTSLGGGSQVYSPAGWTGSGHSVASGGSHGNGRSLMPSQRRRNSS